MVKGKVRVDGMVVQSQGVAGQSKRHEPIGLVSDLQKFVFDILDEYHQLGMLTWHNGGIPEDQIWLKIGGDHGKGSLKMSVQVANLDKPNSKEHTHYVIAMINAKETIKVLHQLTININPEIQKLKLNEMAFKIYKKISFLVTMHLCATELCIIPLF